MTTSSQRNLVRLAAAAIGAGALAVTSAALAVAHVTISPGSGPAGSYAVLTVGVPHGCDGSPTTRVAIEIPEQILTVTPTVNPNWTVETVMVNLDTPVTDSHGTELTERVGQVVYTAVTPLPDHLRDAFELSVRLPEEAAGETLAFPAVQSCEQGETAWVQLAAEGQSGEELEAPAPLYVVTEPEPEEAAETAAPAADDEAATEEPVEDDVEEAAAVSDDGSGTGWGIAGLVLGAIGAVLGAVALLRTRRQA
jgi:periplasmic copper chaperone A